MYKLSHPVYRGMCLQDGMFSQMQGCHYVNYCIEGGKYVTYFKCAENVDDIPAQQAASIEYFGDVNKDLEMERGLTKVVQTHGELTLAQKLNYNLWAKKADYNASLLCYTQGGAGISTGECAHLWNYGSWGNGDTDYITDNDLPTEGGKCVNAVVVGCYSNGDFSSARSVGSDSAVSADSVGYAGRFALPYLQL